MDFLPKTCYCIKAYKPMRREGAFLMKAERPGTAVVLGDYKGLAVTRRYIPVRPLDVEREVDVRRRRAAVLCPTDQPAARRDEVCVDFAGYDASGAPIPDSSMQNITLVLGSGRLLPGAEDAIAGRKAGETFRFAFRYPEQFRVPALSGQQAEFEITLRTVRRQVLPAADDAFAQSQGYADMAALRAAILAEKQAQHAANADRGAMDALLDKAAAGLTVEFAPGQLDELARQELASLQAGLQQSRLTLEMYLKSAKTTREALLAQLRGKAEQKLRRALAVRCIAQAEGLAATETEVEAEYARLAARRGITPEQARKGRQPQAVADALTEQKVRAWLLANARVTTVEQRPASAAPGTER